MTEPPGDPIETLFHQAVELPPWERAAFLDAACGGNSGLRAEVEDLLACDEHAPSRGGLLDNPPLRRAANGAENQPAFGPPAAPGEVGVLGPYRLVKPLGEGGMGRVYVAFDSRLDRRVALKVMLPQFAEDATARERFVREARAAARITHDNVVTVYEADERDGVPYIAMQLLEGRSLDEQLCVDGAPPLPEILRIAAQAAEGLAAAHRIGLVHRDVKPANLWLEAPHGRVKVLDFGLATALDSRAGATLSMAAIGTPAYMSPEQARGEKVDHRTDLFSLGAVLYRLCGGRLPFDGPSTMAMLMKLGMDDPPPLRELNPAVPEPLADLIHQMLAKKPGARPQSAAEVALRVRAMIDGTIPPARPTASALAPKKAGVSRRWSTAIAAALLAVAASGAILIIRNRDGLETEQTAVPLAADPDRDAAAWALSLGGTVRVNGEESDLKAVVDLPEGRFTLTAVNLRGKAVTDAGLSRLRGLPGLTELQLESTPVSDAGLPCLAECRKLRALWLNNTAVSGAGMAHLGNLQDLSDLYLGGTGVDDSGLGRLGKLKGLNRLFLQGTRVTDVGLAQLRELPNLKGIDLWGTSVTNAGLVNLKDCRGLSNVGLGATQVRDAGLVLLKGLPALTELSLNYTPITDAALEHLRDCRGLRILHLGDTEVTNAGVSQLRGLSDLMELTLERTRVTDAGLANLRDLPGLRLLRLGGASMTDAGLEHLKAIKGLKRIEVGGTGMTAEGLRKFHVAMPRCAIEYDGGVIEPTDDAARHGG